MNILSLIPNQTLIEIATAGICGLISIGARALERHWQKKEETTYLAIMADVAADVVEKGLRSGAAPGLVWGQRVQAFAGAAWAEVLVRKPEIGGAFRGQASAILHKLVHDQLEAQTPSGNVTVNLPSPVPGAA